VRLALNGRDRTRLEAVAGACRAKGAAAETGAFDVTDQKACADWIAALEAKGPLDLVIANAGVGLEGKSDLAMEQAMRETLRINIDGVLNTVLPALAAMRARKSGQIAIVASLAGFVGLPQSAAYNGSKAAVRVWGESLRLMMAPEGVGVSVICPGFVKSRLTDKNKFRMPFLMSAERSAQIVLKGLANNKGRIAYPWQMRAAVWLGEVLPASLAERLMRQGSRR
jgi:short-subunit dehydrogenase